MTVLALATLVGGCNLVLGFEPATLDVTDAGAGGGTSTASSTATSSTGGTSCSDGMKNGEETAKDCGGGSCEPCSDGEVCIKNADCQSDVCSMGECAPPPCTAAPCGGDTLLAKRFGDMSDQFSKNITTDGINHYITGNFGGTLDFAGGGPLTSLGATNIFSVKWSATEDCYWSTRYGDMSIQSVESIAVDNDQNVVLSGEFLDMIDFGGGSLKTGGGQDVFVAKFGPSDFHVWSKRFGDSSDQFCSSTAVDKSGNILVTGRNEGTIDFGGSALKNPTVGQAGGGSIFVAKLDPMGTHLWSQEFGDGANQEGTSIIADAQGNIVLLAQGNGTVNFGGAPLASNGGDVFVAKFDAMGKHMWSHAFGDSAIQYADRLAVDGMGNVFILAEGSGSIDFGGGTLTAAGGSDVFIAKFDPAGKHIWSRRFGYPGGFAAGAGLALDATSNVFLTGGFSGQIDFGGGLLTSAGKTDVFAVKLNAKGKHLWSRRFGDANDQKATGATFAGGLFITGQFTGSIDFGTGPLSTAGGNDVFVVKLYP
jgi:hypothetical protein